MSSFPYEVTLRTQLGSTSETSDTQQFSTIERARFFKSGIEFALKVTGQSFCKADLYKHLNKIQHEDDCIWHDDNKKCNCPAE